MAVTMTATKMAVAGAATLVAVPLIFFYADDGMKKISLQQSGVPVTATVTELNRHPTNSRVYHTDCYVYESRKFCTSLAGVDGYVVGQQEKLIVDKNDPSMRMESESGNEVSSLIGFCAVAGLFAALGVMALLRWNFSRD